jgi:NADH-quinone oxidoreductase subunit J
MVEIIFYILAAITLGTAFLTLLSRNPIHSAIYLVICFFSLAGHYILLNAQFLAIVHIIVYSGAIMILILFTIMLMNLNEQLEKHKPTLSIIAAVAAFCLLGLILLSALVRTQPLVETYYHSTEDFQGIKVLGQVLMNEYLVPFEFVSVLLLVAMIGAVLISKKEQLKAK